MNKKFRWHDISNSSCMWLWQIHFASFSCTYNKCQIFKCLIFAAVGFFILLSSDLISYGSEIWAPQGSSRDLAIIEGVQRRASKFILQDYELPYPERLKKLNLLPISYWMELKDLVFFFKCKHGLFDLDISSFVTFSSNSSSHTRSSSDNLLHVNHCRTSLFRNSFFNRIVFLWNNLSPTIRNSSSISSFKNRLTVHYSSLRTSFIFRCKQNARLENLLF